MRDRTDSRANVYRLTNTNSKVSTARPVLCIDLLPDQLATARSFMPGANVSLKPLRYREFTDLSLEKFRPELVVAPLFSEFFDAVDVAETLAFAGYFGELWAICPELPNPQLIEQELREFTGGISLRLIMQQARARTGTSN